MPEPKENKLVLLVTEPLCESPPLELIILLTCAAVTLELATARAELTSRGGVLFNQKK